MYIVHCFPFWGIQVHVILLEQRTRTHAHSCIPPPPPPPPPPPHTAQTTLDACIQNFSKNIFTSYEEWGWENCQHCRARVATANHTKLEFYPTKITSSSAASGRRRKECFTNNTTSKSAGKKIKVSIQTNYLNTTAKTKFQKTIRHEAAYQMLRMLTKVWGSGNGGKTTDTDKPTQIDTQKNSAEKRSR